MDEREEAEERSNETKVFGNQFKSHNSNSGIGDNSKKMGRHATVESSETLLAGDSHEGVHDACVLRVGFAESCANNFVGIVYE